jgi:hypothetical protein
VLISIGSATPVYGWLYAVFPPLHGIRAISRFGYLAIVAVAALAGFGLVDLRRRMPVGWRAGVSTAAIVVAAVEPLAAPLGLSRFEGIPPVYATLRNVAGAVVAELPMALPRNQFVNAPFLLNSTAHWKPMLNGYSGFLPGSYVDHYEALVDFPSPRSLDALRRFGVTHVFVHFDRFTPENRSAIRTEPMLRAIAEDGDIVLYEVLRR